MAAVTMRYLLLILFVLTSIGVVLEFRTQRAGWGADASGPSWVHSTTNKRGIAVYPGSPLAASSVAIKTPPPVKSSSARPASRTTRPSTQPAFSKKKPVTITPPSRTAPASRTAKPAAQSGSSFWTRLRQR